MSVLKNYKEQHRFSFFSLNVPKPRRYGNEKGNLVKATAVICNEKKFPGRKWRRGNIVLTNILE